MKRRTNDKFTKKFAHLLRCIRSLLTELFTAFEKFAKPRSFESKILKEVERVKIQLLRYISIFHFPTLATPADAIYHKILPLRQSFLAKEAGNDVRF